MDSPYNMDSPYSDDLSVGLRKAGARVQAVAWILGVLALLLSTPRIFMIIGPRIHIDEYTLAGVVLLPIGGLLVILVGQAVNRLCAAATELLDRQPK